MLSNFLKEVKNLGTKEVVYVIGNEAADLDSVASAICLAYTWENFDGKPLVPVVNNRKEVLCMRGEIIHALSRVGLTLEDLVYADALPAEFECILVDHNEPSLKWVMLKYRVRAIVDHHADSGLFIEASPRIVRVCASTCSLIADLCNAQVAEEIKPLLELAIVFDTVNWTWRATDFDIQIGQKLFYASNADELHTKCAGIMEDIEGALIDEAALEPYLLLFKDFKSYKCSGIAYGTSVVHIPLLDFMRNDPNAFALNEADKFLREEGLEFLVILTAVREPGQYTSYQELALFSRSQERYSRLIEHLTPPVQLVSRQQEFTPSLSFGLFDHLNLDISRKKLAPMIQHFLSANQINEA